LAFLVRNSYNYQWLLKWLSVVCTCYSFQSSFSNFLLWLMQHFSIKLFIDYTTFTSLQKLK